MVTIFSDVIKIARTFLFKNLKHISYKYYIYTFLAKNFRYVTEPSYSILKTTHFEVKSVDNRNVIFFEGIRNAI